MAEDKITLEELMNQVRQQKPGGFSFEEGFESCWDEELDSQTAPSVETEINLEECIRETMEKLQPFDMLEKDLQTVREFLTFHVESRQRWREKSERFKTNFNLMILGEEEDRINDLVDILRNALNIPAVLTERGSEPKYIERALEINGMRMGRERALQELVPENRRLIQVSNCQPAPMISMDGTASERDKARRMVEAYQLFWGMVRRREDEASRPVIIASCTEDVYRSSLRANNEVPVQICAYHIHVRSRTEEEIMNDCLKKLRSSTFTIDGEFETAFRSYIRAVYRGSVLKGNAFIDEQVRRIYNRFFSKRRDSFHLTADCLPAYDPQILSAEAVLGKLDSMVGLEAVKNEFWNIYTMQLAGLSEEKKIRYHMSFTGNPGTGKTTVARMAADLFYRMNVIKTNKLVVVKPSDLVSEWVGGTGKKTMEVIQRAYNGVLFIDEAYGIANMDRGEELLNVLIQEMENNSDKLIVIFAGYVDEMRRLMKANPGLASRIGRQIHFENYSLDELVQIFLSKCREDGFTVHETARDEAEHCISALMTREFFGNARDVGTMLQELEEIWSDEYYELAKKHGAENVRLEKVFLPKHFEKIMPPKKEVSIQDLVGLETMKKKLEEFKRQVIYQKFLREKGFPAFTDFSMHMIFTGNPGTGKTTVAKLIADDLYSIGMLKTNHLVVVDRKDLVGTYGNTAEKTNDAIRRAVGGVMFVDEAYSLADNSRGGLGNEAIEVFLTAMEEHKADTVFIFAGYVDEMNEFLAMNPGIQSRIGYTFHFEDYTAAELTKMYAEKLRKAGFTVSADALKKVEKIMAYFEGTKNFGNGRFVNHVIQQTVSKRASRSFQSEYQDIDVQDVPDIKTLIETAANSMHLYDPAKITPEEHRRTALHELGHAVVMVATDPTYVPESISINSHAGSFGRVKLPGGQLNQTEQDLIDMIASLLGGKNAEKEFFGSHCTGCVSDYNRAKRIAQNMIENYAMQSFGTTPRQIISHADQMSQDIIARNRKAMEEMVKVLLDKKELSGREFVELMKKYQ